jgi:hypothetical protein
VDLVNRFFLFERPVGDGHPEMIDFRSDGTCTLDLPDRRGAAGRWEVNGAGELVIETVTPAEVVFADQLEMGRHLFKLSGRADGPLLYVRAPAPPFVPERDILGIRHMHNDFGDAFQDLRPDHTFRMHTLDLVPMNRTWFEHTLDGAFAYEDGIVTYRFAHADLPRDDVYIRDFVLKRDDTCLWIVDPFADGTACGLRATSLALPPPPEGYQPGK